MTNELENRRAIQSRWRPVVLAFGMDEPSHKPEETFLLASAIMGDRVVDQLAMRPEFQIPDAEFPCAVEPDWAKIGTALGPAGRASLAERIRSMK
jgi:hypothetical protein